MGESTKIQDILFIIKKRMLLVVSITTLSVLISGIISYFFLTPVYESSTQLLINQTNSEQPSGTTLNVQANLELINTYRVIITSPAILELVKNEMNLDRSIKELSDQVSISSEQNSQVVTITVQDTERKNAVEIANTIARVFQDEVKVIMNFDNVTILSMANEEASKEPIKPRQILNMLIAFTLSLIATIGLAFLLEYFDDTIKSEQDIKSFLDLPTLGSIPLKKVKDYQEEGKKNSKEGSE